MLQSSSVSTPVALALPQVQRCNRNAVRRMASLRFRCGAGVTYSQNNWLVLVIRSALQFRLSGHVRVPRLELSRRRPLYTEFCTFPLTPSVPRAFAFARRWRRLAIQPMPQLPSSLVTNLNHGSILSYFFMSRPRVSLRPRPPDLLFRTWKWKHLTRSPPNGDSLRGS
ncbi:hypothetical protein EVAR_56590_1 [Eumeta japonica]|uniref:Uncharacterized protein n=1 Tax=Eumeta variegata TaxID=151549 RepID=A0A4C1Z159_EUMVA|nr:hypothetical protein EVAR_56590_1 [Eumeta japonica]